MNTLASQELGIDVDTDEETDVAIDVVVESPIPSSDEMKSHVSDYMVNEQKTFAQSVALIVYLNYMRLQLRLLNEDSPVFGAMVKIAKMGLSHFLDMVSVPPDKDGYGGYKFEISRFKRLSKLFSYMMEKLTVNKRTDLLVDVPCESNIPLMVLWLIRIRANSEIDMRRLAMTDEEKVKEDEKKLKAARRKKEKERQKKIENAQLMETAKKQKTEAPLPITVSSSSRSSRGAEAICYREEDEEDERSVVSEMTRADSDASARMTMSKLVITGPQEHEATVKELTEENALLHSQVDSLQDDNGRLLKHVAELEEELRAYREREAVGATFGSWEAGYHHVKADAYMTPPDLIEVFIRLILLVRYPLLTFIWDPCAGVTQNIVRAVCEAGFQGIGSDFYNYEGGQPVSVNPEQSFVQFSIPDGREFAGHYKACPLPDDMQRQAGISIIVTNVPFSLKSECLQRAIDLKIPFYSVFPTEMLGYAKVFDFLKEKNAELFFPKGKIKFHKIAEDRHVEIGGVCWIGLNTGFAGVTYLD